MDNFNLKNYRTIFFDLFHTLTYPGIINNEINEWNLFNIPEKLWIQHSINTYEIRGTGRIKDPKKIIESILKSANIDFDQKKIEEAAHLRIEKFKKCLKAIKTNILNTLQHLHDSGIKLCLISNADAIDIMGWQDSPLHKYFRYAVFSCEVGIIKPDREIYEYALIKMRVNGEKCLFVGDGGSNEFIGAKMLNMDTLMTTEFIKDLWPERIGRISQDADYMVSDLSEMVV
ncbi:MAG: HAD family hydrolase [Spirochaetes bacterium]|nr:HAD family hydrolase [Spirochaetota bacterium]